MAESAIPLAEEAQGRRRQMLRTAFGPTIAAALADPTVIEVMVNPDGRLWIEKAAVGRRFTGERLGAAEAERIKGLSWTGELIERWPRPAATSPVLQTPTPMEPAEGAPELPPTLRETSQPAAAAPSPDTAARTVEARTDTAPLPGLPGGAPLQERLSPFRVVAGKSKRDRR